MTSNLWLAAIAAPLNGGFQHGFQLGIFNIIQNIVNDWYLETQRKRDINFTSDVDIMGPVMMSCLAIGGLLGSSLSFLVADKMGRKQGTMMTLGILILGLITMCLAKYFFSYEVLIIGRFIMGICVGLNSAIVPMYLIEISPDKYRGLVGSTYGVMVALGFLCAIILTFPELLGTNKLWPVVIGLSVLPAIVQALIFPSCKESPKYVFINQGDDDEGQLLLAWFRGNSDIDIEIDMLREEAQALKDIGPVTIQRMFFDQTIRSPLIISAVIMLGHQFCGINMVLCYSYDILRKVHFTVYGATYLVLGMAIVYLVVTILAAVLAECIGRKPLILSSFGGMTFVTMCMTVAYILAEMNDSLAWSVSYFIITFQFFYVLTFALGAATIPWFITQELHNHNARPLATSLVVTVGWLGSFIFYMSFLPLLITVGSYIYAFYFVANLCTTIFLKCTMRETMDESAVNIIEMFYAD